MNLREKLSSKPALIGIAALVVIVAIWLVVGSSGGSAQSIESRRTARGYYSDDDGKTFFEDDLNKFVPFTHDGKEAVRAIVYTCDNGSTKFVALLQKLPPEARKAAEQERSDYEQLKAAGKSAALPDDYESSLLVKKPGAGQWVRANTPQGEALESVTCPSGGTPKMTRP